jgi:UDP-glucose 4-epimerase
MKVLVTGGSGFIGSHVVDKLIDAGHEPVIYDRIPSRWHASVPTVVGELDDLQALTNAMEGCGSVMHLAAAADVNEVAKEPVGSEACNARGTLMVLEAARSAEVPRVVYASTIWVYTGESGEKVDEDSPLRMPAHLYTASKLAGEMYCTSYGELYGLETTILRFGIPYGPRARPAAVVPAFVGKALAGEPLTVAGSGDQSRRFVYVEDLADGCVKALAPVAADRIYNLVSDESVTILQIAETVQDLVGPVGIEHTDARTADFVGVEVSGVRARRELDWVATTPFREGTTRYVAWRRGELEAPVAVPAPAKAKERTAGPLAVREAVQPRTWAAFCGVFVLASVAMLIAYLMAVHSTGLSSGEARTVGTTMFLSLGAYLVIELLWPEPELHRSAQIASGVLAGLFIVFVMTPWGRNIAHLAEPSASAIVLCIAGAGLAIALAATALWLARAGGLLRETRAGAGA